MRANFPVTFLCEKLGVSTSGFYEWDAGSVTATTLHHNTLIEQVIVAFATSHRASGYRKVTAALHREGTLVDRKTVAGIMRDIGLIPRSAQRAFRRAKVRAARHKDPVDLLNRDFTAMVPGTVLVGDMTYVPTKQGWLYTATVIDLASRKILGYATGARMTTPLIIRAMDMALTSGLITPGSIFHSDHGSQYRSKKFARYCGHHGIRQSMGGRMECWDNAAAESFFSKMKGERLDWITFTTRRAAAREVTAYIQHYNHTRLHQTLGYLTPEEKLTQPQRAA